MEVKKNESIGKPKKMKISKKEDESILQFQRKIKEFFKNENDFMSVFSTLLGASDNICKYIIENEKWNYNNLPYQCRYGMVQIYQMLNLMSKILRDEITQESFNIGGYFPATNEAWKSESDFEKRFILIIKLFHKQLKEEGKL